MTRDGFADVVGNAFASKGFGAEASQVLFASNMFLPGSDLSPLAEKFTELMDGLTTWEPETKQTGVRQAEMLRVEGPDESSARRELQNLFSRSLWSDGLPLEPPTVERVDWILTGTDRSRDQVLGRIDPRAGVASVEQLAVSLAMAGGRPEYLPVLIAAVEAMLEPSFGHGRMNTTTCSVAPVVIVSGPIAHDMRLSSGYGALGPNPLRPAGASIGRALRFLLMNVGGAVPGQTTMSIFGGPARYTGLVFAEDESGLPESWESLGEAQGFARGANAVTLYAVSSTTNIPGGETGTDDAALASLNRASGSIGIPNGNYWDPSYNERGAAGILLMARGTARGLETLDWSKAGIQDYLWTTSKVPADKLGPRIDAWWMPSDEIFEDPMPIATSPEGIRLVVAGGDQSGHMMWLQSGCCPEEVVSAPVELPGAWKELLEQAEVELGPIPVAG